MIAPSLAIMDVAGRLPHSLLERGGVPDVQSLVEDKRLTREVFIDSLRQVAEEGLIECGLRLAYKMVHSLRRSLWQYHPSQSGW